MKRAVKKKSNLYSYLDAANVLESGTDIDIAQARKAYWKAYSVEWRRKQRKETKQFTIPFTPAEAKELFETAKKHKRSQTRFIKESCMAYMRTQYLVPDVIALRSIQQHLAMNYNILQKLFDENIIPYQTGTILLKHMTDLEQQILVELYHPQSVEKLILDTVATRPEYKEIIIKLLEQSNTQ